MYPIPQKSNNKTVKTKQMNWRPFQIENKDRNKMKQDPIPEVKRMMKTWKEKHESQLVNLRSNMEERKYVQRHGPELTSTGETGQSTI